LARTIVAASITTSFIDRVEGMSSTQIGGATSSFRRWSARRSLDRASAGSSDDIDGEPRYLRMADADILRIELCSLGDDMIFRGSLRWATTSPPMAPRFRWPAAAVS
jgi:hypothetical protein